MLSILTLATDSKIMSSSVQLTALDGTGLESHHVCRYFIQRKDRSVKERSKMTDRDYYEHAQTES